MEWNSRELKFMDDNQELLEHPESFDKIIQKAVSNLLGNSWKRVCISLAYLNGLEDLFSIKNHNGDNIWSGNIQHQNTFPSILFLVDNSQADFEGKYQALSLLSKAESSIESIGLDPEVEEWLIDIFKKRISEISDGFTKPPVGRKFGVYPDYVPYTPPKTASMDSKVMDKFKDLVVNLGGWIDSLTGKNDE